MRGHAINLSGSRQSRPMPHLIQGAIWVGITVALLATISPAASAQFSVNDSREQLERELGRTDEQLEGAWEVVKASESDRARHLLNNATMIQQTAWDLFSLCGLTNARACSNSAKATTRARREIRHAVQVAREDSSQERAAQQAIDRAQRMVDEAGSTPVMDSVADDRLQRLLGQAQAQLERAREQFRERHFGVALQLANGSMRLIQQALQVDDGQQWHPDRVGRELERTQRLLDRAAPVIRQSGNQRALQLLEHAIASQDRARRALDDRRPLLAVRHTREARGQAQRALGMAEGPIDLELARRAIQQTDQLITRVEPEVREAGIERALELLEKGLERQVKARELLDQERLNASLAQTRVARRLVNEALDMVRRSNQLTP